jgi:hypothetical protein
MVNKLNSSYNKYMKKVLIADLLEEAEEADEQEIYTTNLNNALEEYTRDEFIVTGTSVTNWGTLETPTSEKISPELDEDSLGTRQDIIDNDINDNPSYTFELFGYSYEVDRETLLTLGSRRIHFRS